MKKVNIVSGVMYVGDAMEVQRAYRHLEKRENIFPEFCEAPKFNRKRKYGLVLTFYDEFQEKYCYEEPRMSVVNADTALAMILEA